MYTKICEYCKQPFEVAYKSQARTRHFCSPKCYDSSRRHLPIATNCHTCGKLLIRSQVKYKQRFCSIQCAKLIERKPRRQVICEHCGKVFYALKPERGFCSKQCANLHLQKNPDKPCEQCGQMIHAPRDNQRFCCLICYNQHRDENRLAEAQYGPNWKTQRRAAYRRDGYRCRICGIDGQLDVHHIRSIREFSGPQWYKKANRLSNLIALCRHCHSQVHNQTLDCPKP